MGFGETVLNSQDGKLTAFQLQQALMGIPGIFRSSHPELFLGKGVLKICSKFTGEHLYRNVILLKLL